MDKIIDEFLNYKDDHNNNTRSSYSSDLLLFSNFLTLKKIKDLIKGYESIKKISLKEKKSLNILCRGAAMRYLLTRLYDYSNTPKTALIEIKDPNEYYQKLITHNNLISYKNYLI